MSDYGSVMERGSVLPKTNAPPPRQPSVQEVIIEEREEEKIKPVNVKKNQGNFGFR